MSRSVLRGVAVLIAGALVGGLLATLPATAAKRALTKKKARKLFYTKAQSDARYLNQNQGDTLYLSQTEGDVRYVSLSATDRGLSTETSTTQTDTITNTVTIAAPTNGVLLIAGSVSVDNDDVGVADTISLSYRVGTGGFVGAAEAQFASPGNSGEEQQMAFTDAVQVTAGGHDVDMQIESIASDSYSYNYNNLSVTFVPQGAIS